MLTCSLCKCFGKHKKCHVIPLNEAKDEDIFCLKNELEKLKNLHERLSAAIMLYKDIIKRREDYKLEAKSRTIEIFQTYQQILQQRKEQMLKFASKVSSMFFSNTFYQVFSRYVPFNVFYTKLCTVAWSSSLVQTSSIVTL